ncbi:MAG: acylphosphatase [Planctomycetota bacterium]|nr:MAG: acylphosphatase [Planctomycetota bacterium]
MERLEVWFSGRVQGVGFRFRTRRLAARFPITGFVRNLADGRVEMKAEGDRQALEQFLDALNRTMKNYIHAQEVDWGPAAEEFSSFEIRR